MEYVIIFAVGFLIGIAVVQFTRKPEIFGTLRVDNSDSDGPYLFLELSKDPNFIYKKKTVTFDVHCENYISRE